MNYSADLPWVSSYVKHISFFSPNSQYQRPPQYKWKRKQGSWIYITRLSRIPRYESSEDLKVEILRASHLRLFLFHILFFVLRQYAYHIISRILGILTRSVYFFYPCSLALISSDANSVRVITSHWRNAPRKMNHVNCRKKIRAYHNTAPDSVHFILHSVHFICFQVIMNMDSISLFWTVPCLTALFKTWISSEFLFFCLPAA